MSLPLATVLTLAMRNRCVTTEMTLIFSGATLPDRIRPIWNESQLSGVRSARMTPATADERGQAASVRFLVILG